MTKKDMAKAIAEEMGLTQIQAKEIVQKVFDEITETLLNEGRIELRNFGVFEVKRRKPRKARNPRTGARVDVEAKNVVTFKPGKKMEEDVGRMPTLPHLEQPIKRPKAGVGSDGNGAEEHDGALETVG